MAVRQTATQQQRVRVEGKEPLSLHTYWDSGSNTSPAKRLILSRCRLIAGLWHQVAWVEVGGDNRATCKASAEFLDKVDLCADQKNCETNLLECFVDHLVHQ